MKLSRFQAWLRQVYGTEPEEISCSDCFDLVSGYVDLELAGEPAHELLPALKQHLGQCRVCREEYEVLRELAEQESKSE